MDAPAPRRPIVRRVVAVAGAVVVALALAEVVLRVTGLGARTPRVDDYPMLIDAGARYWRFDPARKPSHRWDGDPYGCLPDGAAMSYDLNAAGFRGPLPAPGTPSVLVLGDSFTFGEGVADGETFCARLARALAARADARIGAPAFVNTGVPGYGTVEHASRLPSLLDRFAPRAVLLVAVPNDAIPQKEAIDVPDLVNGRADTGPPLRLLALARGVLGRAEADRAVEDWYLSFYTGARRARWDEAREALASIAGECRHRGIPFGVAMFPILHRLADRPFAEIHDAYAGACRELDVPFTDLTPALAAAGERALWVHPMDHHPNARAHGLAADALAPLVDRLLAGGR